MDAGSFEKAKGYAFLLLKFRLRSEKELTERLKRKKFKAEIVSQVLSLLKEKEFIDDKAFARNWLDCRLKRPFGLRRIRQELKLKGIDNGLIENQIERIKEGYCEADIIRDIARERFSKLKSIQPLNAKKRVYAYLLRRGFSPEIVTDVINQLCRQTY